jgi:ADP-ribose pyrophosphatase YjhB (NUDIX family)
MNASEKFPVVLVGVVLGDSEDESMIVGENPKTSQLIIPMGTLENFEEWEECALRLVSDELGFSINIESLSHISTFNYKDIETGVHNLVIFMYSELKNSNSRSLKNCYEYKSFSFIRENSHNLTGDFKAFIEKNSNLNNIHDFKRLIRTYLSLN